MKTKTCRLTKTDYHGKFVTHTCEFCEKEAHYWSQSGDSDGKAHSRCIYHCQNHREQARKLVDSIAK